MTPNLEFWGQSLAFLAIEVALLVGMGGWLASRISAPRHRRTIWLTTFAVLGLVFAGEIAGARIAFHSLESDPTPSRQVVISLLDEAPTFPNPAPESEDSRLSTTQPDSVWWPGLVWLGGFLVVTAYRACGPMILRRQQRHYANASREATAAAERLAQRLRLGSVTVLSWTELRGPVAFGWRRRFLALPADFDRRFNQTQREAILLHELAHLAMRDPLVQAVTGTVCALLWWHPAVWWAHRRLTSAMEATADEASSLIPGGRTALAESLVRLGRELTLPHPTRAMGVAGTNTTSELALRVQALLAPPTGWFRPSWTGRIGVLAAASLVSMGAFAWNWPGPEPVPLSQLLLAQMRPTQDSARTGTPASVPVRVPPSQNPPPTIQYGFEASFLKYFGPRGVEEVEKAIQILNAPKFHPTGVDPSAQATTQVATQSPLVTLEMTFLEVTEQGAQDLGLDWLFGQTSTNPTPLEVVSPSGDLPGAASSGAANIRVERGRLEGQTTVLSAGQLKALLHRLESRGGVDILATPQVTTESGRRAQVKIEDARTIVTEAHTRHGQGTNQPSIHYGTDTLYFGQSVDVLATWSDDRWNLSVLGRVSEFLGYDDPKEIVVEATNDRGDRMTGQLPLPRLRVRETVGEGRIEFFQTLMLRGPVSERVHRTKGSWWRSSRTVIERRRLFVLVTPLPGE